MQDNVPIIVIAVVLVFFTIRLIQLWWRCLYIGRHLQGGIRLLKGIKREEIGRRFADVEAFFQRSCPELEHAWHEFSESLVKRGDEVHNTIDSDHFFSEHALIDKPLGIEFNRHVPGIFTALGIVGTFYGISSGLHAAVQKMGQGEVTAERLTQVTRSLLEYVSPAFQASLISVACAVLFLFIERATCNYVASRLQMLQIQIDRLFPRVIAETYLLSILEQNEQQTRSLKAFSTDLAESIKNSLQLLVAQQVSEMQKSNQVLVDTIGDRVVGQLEPVSQHLKEAVAELKRDQASSTRQA